MVSIMIYYIPCFCYEAGGPWKVMIDFRLTSEFIAEKAKKLISRKEKSDN